MPMKVPEILISRTETSVAKQITLVVTQDCNLSCKYCYMTRKNPYGRML